MVQLRGRPNSNGNCTIKNSSTATRKEQPQPVSIPIVGAGNSSNHQAPALATGQKSKQDLKQMQPKSQLIKNADLGKHGKCVVG
ncbi:hypothetical protein HPP92_010059 [Vanilla planifolia]|uniref:Uncharacterized protein n=1 Tax=Vanilla planifolia TaxID=51239 RepID=A0A835V337_VANPL|nr:hypothetical protein HPP92_010160 [Vanilla planifolia]KAG0481975.1 hypothetical protein HPP92_010059 [Vanilla planifolia]